MHRAIGPSALLLVSGTLLCACGTQAGASAHGSLRFEVWGESYVERGIVPADFEDGWSIAFTKFLIVLGDVTVADRNAGPAGGISGTQLFDLVSTGAHEVGTLPGIEARSWDDVGYSVPAIDPATTLHPSAGSDDMALMRGGGYSLYVAGTAVKDVTRKRFAWGFTSATRYAECVARVDGKETLGIVVPDGGNESVELTIHGDHFFYDDLASPDAVLRFDAIAAADVDGNGDVTLGELAQVDLVEIAEGTYGTGGASQVDDLGAFVSALAASVGHFRGEGHCISRRP